MFQRTSSGVRSLYLNELFADFAQISNISFGNVVVDTVACNKIIERSTGQGVQIAGGLIINGIAFFNGINLPNLPTQHYIGIDNDGYITHAINSPNLHQLIKTLVRVVQSHLQKLNFQVMVTSSFVMIIQVNSTMVYIGDQPLGTCVSSLIRIQ